MSETRFILPNDYIWKLVKTADIEAARAAGKEHTT